MQFLTIKEESRQGFISEFQLRRMLKQKRLPGFYAGTRFYVNHDLLIELLAQESRKNAGE